MEIMILLYHRWYTSVNRGRNILKISQSAKWQTRDTLKEEVQRYVKEHTAPYKYPRIVVFRDELPKTISGKIQRNLL